MTIKPEAEYQVAINKNNSEGEIQWNRYNAMLVINTIFIALIGFTYKGEAPVFLRFILSLLGIFLCLLWGRMTKRGFMWIKFWIEIAREIETKFGNTSSIKPISRGKKEKEKKENRVIFNTENSSYTIIVIFVLIYTLIFLFDLFPIACNLCQNK